MIKQRSQRIVIVFWLLASADLAGILFSFSWLVYVAKPLLMPSLILLVFWHKSIKPVAGKKFIVAGLFFAWLGDICLLFDSFKPILFIAGLVCFLVTHSFYIRYFLSIKSNSISPLKEAIYDVLILCYGAGLLWVLFPYLGSLKIPVILYTIVICSMLISSLHIYRSVTAMAGNYFVTGAILFVLSDSMLAINKFYHPLPLAGVWIMLSYCAAQYFIAKGFCRMENLDLA